ncbi:pitrilysin family protein [Clostridium sp. AL.422]|uniref:M16 family metallopeptidase n=1 Tax=Clostridium TaxID=1485 RepID=UPI00293DFA1F|nr:MULTISPECIES: pitrilysin family protein [unclassified Clostridium]MDV4151731.1 pitrilysin family protein [Clostridium sp. AL.422]
MEILLNNGIKLIYKKTISKLTSISISIDAGACKEKEIFGLAHATEHMLYKGTKNRSEVNINKELSRIFGFQNAMTNYPYVIYYGTMLNEDFEKAVDIFSDILINPTFKEEGFIEEMSVIREELSEWDEELDQFCEDKLYLNSFQERRIKYPIIGRMKDLDKITLNDIIDFYNKNYKPENTSIAVVSSLDIEEIKLIIEKYFMEWESNKESFKDEAIYDIDNFNIFKDIREGINGCKVQMIFPIDELNYDEMKALRIFNEYFGDGVNSVLFNNLRTKNGLIYDIITKIAYEKYIKLYKITFSTSKKNLKKTLDIINECIESVKNSNLIISEEDIIDYVKSIKLKKLFREEQNIILAKELSTYSTMFGNFKIYDEELEEIDKIRKEDIVEVTRKVFNNKSIQIISN